ncbi:conserved hypothetical protein [Vibrio nigripulchritudo SOn1]|uniref:Bacteriophage T5 Orf172 DNA-binding domain-containing protein n=1 Tax=Vibrio nigripulchritudo SOn1 TaxID=1238450 RepID=A0AAV2VIC9_9VIBR|nr:GIY-YIG nuclease family protein [Vibrio nigripulchritudo]CCO44185.1 conserved hypothetical protein [Vibrio nigripulchritudo SOn1]
MAVYLSMAKDDMGNLHHIDSQPSGRSLLMCPFCNCRLIAVKGLEKKPHFRHDGGAVCKESLNEIPQIPAWHHFHLNYSLKVIEVLQAGYQPESKSPNVFKLRKSVLSQFPSSTLSELFDDDYWTDSLVFTDTARVIVGSLTLQKFSQWMRSAMQRRVHELKENIEQGKKHPAWLQIEAHRQQSILRASLYLFEFHCNDDSVFHKVGRTLRDPEQRLKETSKDLEKATNTKVVRHKILRLVTNSGHVEKYVFHRYKSYLANIGDHTEYLLLDTKTARALKAEFTKLTNNTVPFNKHERFIVNGRWKYEEKRLAASKRGIALTQRENGKFGRPKGSTMNQQDFLDKHSDVVESLKRGRSIIATAEFTGKSRSTVKRVKNTLGSVLQEQLTPPK